jgi:hypothetical protein
MSAYTPRASLSVGGNRGSAAILLTDTAAQLCAAFFDRPGYPAARCTFRPAFTHDVVFRDSAAFWCHDGTSQRNVAQSCQTTHHGAIALHRPLILNWFLALGAISAGIVEGFNGKAKLTTRKAYGFRTP